MHPTLVTQMGQHRRHDLAQEAAAWRRASPEAPALPGSGLRLRHRLGAAVGRRLIAAGGRLVELGSARRTACPGDDAAP
jgi:hypothetical protein